MSPINLEDLSSSQNQKKFHAYVGQCLRSKSFDIVESEIRAALENTSDPIAKAALNALNQPMELTGYDYFLNFISGFMVKGHSITAIGVDLYGNDSGVDQLALEISLYDDSSFPFQTTSAEEIQTAAFASTPWQGDFIECSYGLGIKGLEILRDHWRSLYSQDGKTSHQKALCSLIEAALYSRAHMCIHKLMPELGLPKAMPVIIGENDWGRAPQTVILIEKVVPQIELKEIQSKLSKNKTLPWYKKEILERNARIRQTYDMAKPFQSKLQRRKVKVLTGLAEAELAIAKVKVPKRLFRMKRDDFEQFMSLLDRIYETKS